ncbi:hypothetical protein D9V62_01620 [Buchnera aphidicola (Aphis helianthi)]|uniref:Uncharacterized protein n=1 Tax=Buchnera aphidicola (Aphis helianthi) TaxID=2315802 RepID=A0A4D6XNU1_9GAMM|nr:peptidoglycan DD-metalloendopeptidase family protein [Buchnera aphidicola]QCI17139.1 hypothetical protein D9V62_01620 [Buchnera aphidicola (Aphis helianthi)]
MQYIYKKIYKKISLFFNYKFNFYNISTCFINTVIISTIFLSNSVFSENKKFFYQFIINKNYEVKNNIFNKQNQKVNIQDLKNYKKIKNKSNLIPYLSKISNHKFIKKVIYIKNHSNFFKSAFKSGFNLYDINTIIKAIEWQISFHKLNTNSVFNLIFLKKKINSKKNKNILLGIKLNNLRKTYYAIRAVNGHFYNLNGFNKAKMIMNFSFLKKYRISSHFNLHRLHPITHHISRHLGVDLAMPKNTLILATSNGKTIKTGFNKISGFFIVLKHHNECLTKYMHLNKILVKVGQIVKINQKIALSGNTGRTTGPHLHYEIWINKHPINPICAPSNFVEQLTKKERISFLKTSKIILSQLN